MSVPAPPPYDNASIITLASSSKRRKSLDTNASTRALAPSSLWGSRESLRRLPGRSDDE
ncbi:uncharacterized protein V1510DRAFT_411531 [Dipodascopsis tothii]|uniref:uncharacterized protein n=1 Tax=Dipodascopsis tothii TaxID=44089 RepID=UPI0034CFBA3F